MDQVPYYANQFTPVASPHVPMRDAAEGIHVWMFGIMITLKALGNETGGSYSVVQDTIPPGIAPPPNLHTREDGTWYLLDGELEWNVGGQVYHATKGSLIHLPRFVPHSLRNKSDKDARMLVTFTPAGFEMFMLEAGEIIADRDNPGEPPKQTPELMEKTLALAQEQYGIIYPDRTESLHSSEDLAVETIESV